MVKMRFWAMNKRGISPLVALIVLVSFSVALGVLVINLLSLLFVEDACESVEVELLELRDFKPLCVDYAGGRVIRFVVRNAGTVEIEQLKIAVITSSDLFQGDLVRLVKPAERLDMRDGFRFDAAGEVKEITITPIVRQEGSIKSCIHKEMTYTDIPVC
jgi:hypothetical protein